MKLLGVFIKFTGLYLLIKIIMFVALAMLNYKSNIGVGVVATLIIATRISCESFTKKNGVFFSKSEFWKVVFGFALINMLFVGAGTYLALTSASIQMSPPIIIALIIEAGLLHTAVIYFSGYFSGKQFEKRMAMNAYNNQIQIYSTSVLSEAHILKDIIESHGIPCDVRTENRSNLNMVRDLPLSTESSLWISDKSKLDEVRRLIEEYEKSTPIDSSPANDSHWNCASCGEESEGQFTSCWNCGGFKVA